MEIWPQKFKLVQYNQLDSTNSEAKRLAFKDEIDICVSSRMQTNGKGSRGRKWVSGSRNLAASFLFYPSGNLIEFSQLKFLLEGINKKNKFINFYVNKISFNFKNEYGYFGLTGDDFEGETVLNENVSLNLNVKNLDINLKEIFPINENRVLFSKNGELTLKVYRDNENWQAPINFKLDRPSSTIENIGEKITVSTVANWSKSDSNCKWVDLLSQNNQCGILRDFLNTNISLNDSGGGVLLIEGNGTCVTPSSDCPQRIDAEIKSKKTTQVFSKIMVSGVVNPLLGGVLLSGLLTSPTKEGEAFDHKINFKMIGAQILLNDKPLL